MTLNIFYKLFLPQCHHGVKKIIAIITIVFISLFINPVYANLDASLKKAKSLSVTHPQKAIAYLTQIIKAHPETDRAYFLLGNIFMAKKNYRNAEIEYREALSLHHKDKYEIALAEALMVQDRVYEALRVLSFNGLDIQAQKKKKILRANAYLYLKATEDALFTIEDLEKELPKDTEILLTKAKIYEALKQKDNAKKTLKKALSIAPKDVAALTYLGHNYAKRRQYDKALNYYETALTLDDKYTQAIIGKSRIFLVNKDYQKALEYARMALKQSPYHPEAYHVMALSYYYKGNIDLSADLYNNISLESKASLYPPALLFQANVFYKKKNFVSAERAVEKYITLYPQSVDARLIRAYTKIELKLYQQAIRDLKYLMIILPDNIDIYNYLAASYVLSDNFKEAYDIFEQILDKFPKSSKNTFAKMSLKYACNGTKPIVKCDSPDDKDLSKQIVSLINLYFTKKDDEFKKRLQEVEMRFGDNEHVLKIQAFLNYYDGLYAQSYASFYKIFQKNPKDIENVKGLLLLTKIPSLRQDIFNQIKNIYHYLPLTQVGTPLIKLAMSLEQYEFSMGLIEKMLRFDTENTHYQKSFVAVAFKNKKYALILDKINHFSPHLKGKPDIMYILSQSYHHLGNKEIAYAFYKKLDQKKYQDEYQPEIDILKELFKEK